MIGAKRFPSLGLPALPGLVVLSALSGCSATVDSRLLRPEGSLAPVRCVAVLPFDNLTRFPYAGKIAAEIVGVELLQSRMFNVMERAEVERVFMTRGIVPPPSVDVSFAVEAGKILGVEGIIVGTVSEYYYRKTSRATQEEEPVVGMTIRLIEVSSSQALWSGTITKVSGSVFLAMREPINKIALQAVEQVLHPLLVQIPERPVDPRNICWSDPRKLLLTASGPADQTALAVRPPAPPIPASVSAPPSPHPFSPTPPAAAPPPLPASPEGEEEVTSAKPAEIAILNGSGIPKAGEGIAKLVILSDLNLVSVGNAKRSNFRNTVVYYRKGFKTQAERLVGLFPKGPQIERSSEYKWDITVVIGKDLARR